MNDAIKATQVAVTNLVDEALVLKDALQAQLSDTDVTVLDTSWVPFFGAAPDHILVRVRDGAGQEKSLLVSVSVKEVAPRLLEGLLS